MKNVILRKILKPTFSLKNLFIFLFSFFAVRSVWLAFDKTIVFVPIGYFCVPLAFFVLYYYYDLRIEKEDFKLLILPSIYWIFSYLHQFGEYKVMVDLLNLLITCTYLILPKELKISIFRCFYWIVQILNIISIIIYICYFLKIPIGFEKVPFYSANSEERGLFYIKWHCFAIYNEFVVFFRLCGVFNEPGGLGTLCALLFIVIYNKSKLWERIILLVTGLLTLSMAFVILIVLFYFLHIYKKHKSILLLPFLLIPLLTFIPNIDFGNANINNLVQRFSITDGGIQNNRTSDDFDKKFEAFKESEDVYFGRGHGYVIGEHSLSYKVYIGWFGFIGAFFLFLCWVLSSYLYSRNNIDCLIVCLLFFLSIYQRPAAIISIFGYILLFGGMSWILKENNENI